MKAEEVLKERWYQEVKEFVESDPALTEAYAKMGIFEGMMEIKSPVLFDIFDKLGIFGGILRKSDSFKIYLNEEELEGKWNYRKDAENALFDKLLSKLEETCQQKD